MDAELVARVLAAPYSGSKANLARKIEMPPPLDARGWWPGQRYVCPEVAKPESVVPLEIEGMHADWSEGGFLRECFRRVPERGPVRVKDVRLERPSKRHIRQVVARWCPASEVKRQFEIALWVFNHAGHAAEELQLAADLEKAVEKEREESAVAAAPASDVVEGQKEDEVVADPNDDGWARIMGDPQKRRWVAPERREEVRRVIGLARLFAASPQHLPMWASGARRAHLSKTLTSLFNERSFDPSRASDWVKASSPHLRWAEHVHVLGCSVAANRVAYAWERAMQATVQTEKERLRAQLASWMGAKTWWTPGTIKCEHWGKGKEFTWEQAQIFLGEMDELLSLTRDERRQHADVWDREWTERVEQDLLFLERVRERSNLVRASTMPYESRSLFRGLLRAVLLSTDKARRREMDAQSVRAVVELTRGCTFSLDEALGAMERVTDGEQGLLGPANLERAQKAWQEAVAQLTEPPPPDASVRDPEFQNRRYGPLVRCTFGGDGDVQTAEDVLRSILFAAGDDTPPPAPDDSGDDWREIESGLGLTHIRGAVARLIADDWLACAARESANGRSDNDSIECWDLVNRKVVEEALGLREVARRVWGGRLPDQPCSSSVSLTKSAVRF